MSVEIPHIIEPHPDTGLNNSKLGIWLFLASEVMLFGALFSSLILLRVTALDWPRGADVLNVPLAFLNTLVLISSSVTMVMAWLNFKQRNFDRGKMFLWLTIACSGGFLVIKTIEYSTKFSHHLFPSTSNFYAIYFTMTGLHAIHVIGGAVVMLYFAIPGAKLWKTSPEQYTDRIEATGLYWHFVDLVWIFLFPSLYLL